MKLRTRGSLAEERELFPQDLLLAAYDDEDEEWDDGELDDDDWEEDDDWDDDEEEDDDWEDEEEDEEETDDWSEEEGGDEFEVRGDFRLDWN